MRVHVAFTPAEAAHAPLGVVVDVLRATSTMTQALASGYARVLCCAEVDEARDVAAAQTSAVLAGERRARRIPGFDLGNSPREFIGPPAAETVVLTTTNGTRLVLAAAGRCDRIVVGSLLNLAAVAEEARRAEEVAILCAGVGGELALDDVYCAGRIAEALGGEPVDSAQAAIRLSRSFATHEEGLASGRSARNLRAASLEEDIPFCARESVLDVVPRFSRMVGTAAEVVVSDSRPS